MNQPQPGGAVPVWSLTDRLVKARTHAALNQADLAGLLGISERTVKRYEAGGTYKRGIILGWALACGVNPTWLETGDDDFGSSSVLGPPTERYRHSNDGWYVDGKRGSVPIRRDGGMTRCTVLRPVRHMTSRQNWGAGLPCEGAPPCLTSSSPISSIEDSPGQRSNVGGR